MAVDTQMEGPYALKCIQMCKYAWICNSRWNKNVLCAWASAEREIIEQVPMSTRHQEFCEVLLLWLRTDMSTQTMNVHCGACFLLDKDQ